MKYLNVLIFALGCHAACKAATKVDGVMTAQCVDEDTGVEFEYVDLDNFLEKDMGIADHQMADVMFTHYYAGKGNVSEHDLDARHLTHYWNKCSSFVSGVCANDHVPNWISGLSAFAGTVTGLLTYANSRLDQSPRSKCTNYKKNGTVCVSWAAYYHAQMTKQQIKDISQECANVCEQAHNSCEARVVTDNLIEYFCVSNRARGCSTNHQIHGC